MSLNEKACIVTGGGRGIGRAVCLRLSGAGARVIAAARTAREVDETARLCRSQSGVCVPVTTDLTRLAEIEALIARCRSEFGRLDVLVNNAGVAPRTNIEAMSDDEFDQLLSVNVVAVFRACRTAWPELKRTNGVIINVSSIAADDPFPGFAAYGGTKAWVNTFTRALAEEGKPAGIKVFAVAPGAVETRMLREAVPELPVDQALTPDHVAAVVELLLDPRSAYASGQVVRVKL